MGAPAPAKGAGAAAKPPAVPPKLPIAAAAAGAVAPHAATGAETDEVPAGGEAMGQSSVASIAPTAEASRERDAGTISFPPSFPTLLGSGPPSTAPGILAPGSPFGVYLVGQCIGEGGMARIYQAEHAGLRRQVALKVLTDGFARSPEGRERFLREARIAAAIKHPNVVNIFDVGVQDDIPYLVMELLEGRDLEKLLEPRRPLDEALIIDIMVPVIAGLIAVHDAGIVHRDLKPGNIFLSRGRYNDIEPKLLDFGISKAAGVDHLKLTVHRTFMGTPFYISPEGLRGGEMTPRSDQYSLGVVMYECAAGVPPFTGATFAELSGRIAAGEYTALSTHNPELSKRLARIIERAMSLDPERRFVDLREMGRELLTLAGQRTRITWGLSFGESHPTLTSGSNHYATGVSAPPGAPTSRGASARARRLWGLAAFMVAAVGFGAWQAGRYYSRRGPIAVSGSAAAAALGSPPPAAAPVAPGPGSEAPSPPPAAMAPAAPLEPSPADTTTASTASTAKRAPSRDVRGARPSDQAASKARATSPVTAGRRAKPSAVDNDAEWALPPAGAALSSAPARSGDGAGAGAGGAANANGAPIFD